MRSASQKCYSQILTGQRLRSEAPNRVEGTCVRAHIITVRMLLLKHLVLPSRSRANRVLMWAIGYYLPVRSQWGSDVGYRLLPSRRSILLTSPTSRVIMVPQYEYSTNSEQCFMAYVLDMALGVSAKFIQPQCSESVL